jgi:enediyne biosynthesis protein E4
MRPGKSCMAAMVAALAASSLTGCQPSFVAGAGASPAPNASPSSAASSGGSSASPGTTAIRFREVAAEAGLTYRWTAPGKRPLNILQTIGNGCAFLDYDRDGNLDILLVGPTLALYKGDGKGKFTDVSGPTRIGALKGYFLGCAVGDVDNDGFSDLYIGGYREGRLLRNNGGKAFTDISRTAGIGAQPWGTSAGFSDLDGDGFLDLYVCNYADFGPDTKPQLCKFKTEKHGEVLSSCGPRYYKGIQSVVYRNAGGKRFENVTKAWGMNTHSGRGLGVAFADIDESGRPAVAVANDEAPGDLFHKTSGAKSWENIGVLSGTAYDRNGSLHGGMGIDWGDYDNDGRFDLFVATFRNEPKSLYHNDGGQLFNDVSYPVGIGRPALPFVTFGTKFFDADNDGWLDLILANGHVQDNIALIENTEYRQKTLLFQNRAPGAFEDVSDAAGVGTLKPIVGRGLATGDYDNDGRVDVLVVDSEGVPLLLHNETPISGTERAWVGFRCIDKSGKEALGAVLTVEQAGEPKRLVRQCQTGGSYLSASDGRVHFGLGKAAATVTLTVRWPDGKTETWPNVATGRYLTVRPGRVPE